MTVADVRAQLAEIRRRRDDDEWAHSAEDALREEVLIAISQGADNASELAREALKTKTIVFSRWCA